MMLAALTTYAATIASTSPHWAFVGDMSDGQDVTGQTQATVSGTLDVDTPGFGDVDATRFGRVGNLILPADAAVVQPAGWSLAFWLRTTGRSQVVFYETGGGGNIRVHGVSGNNTLRLWTNGVGINLQLAPTINDDRWHFVALSHGADSRLTYFADGKFGVRANTGVSGPFVDPRIFVGSINATTARWRGSMAMVAGWRRPLSPDTVQHLYQTGINGAL